MIIDFRRSDDLDSFIALLKATDLHPIKINISMYTQNVAYIFSGFTDLDILFLREGGGWICWNLN